MWDRLEVQGLEPELGFRTEGYIESAEDHQLLLCDDCKTNLLRPPKEHGSGHNCMICSAMFAQRWVDNRADLWRWAAADALEILDRNPHLKGKIGAVSDFVLELARVLRPISSLKAFSQLGVVNINFTDGAQIINNGRGLSFFPEVFYTIQERAGEDSVPYVAFYYDIGNRGYDGWWATQYDQRELDSIFGESRNEELTGDVMKGILGFVRAIRGVTWVKAMRDHVGWGDPDALLMGLERSLLVYKANYRDTLPELNRKRKPSEDSFRTGSAGVNEWYRLAPSFIYTFFIMEDEERVAIQVSPERGLIRSQLNGIVDDEVHEPSGGTVKSDVEMEDVDDGGVEADYSPLPEVQTEDMDVSEGSDSESLAEEANGILSIKYCPICESHEHRLVDYLRYRIGYPTSGRLDHRRMKQRVKCDDGGWVTFTKLLKHRRVAEQVVIPARTVQEDIQLALACIDLYMQEVTEAGYSRFSILCWRVGDEHQEKLKDRLGYTDEELRWIREEFKGVSAPIAICATYKRNEFRFQSLAKHLYPVDKEFAEYCRGCFYVCRQDELEGCMNFGILTLTGEGRVVGLYSTSAPWDERSRIANDSLPGQSHFLIFYVPVRSLLTYGPYITHDGGIVTAEKVPFKEVLNVYIMKSRNKGEGAARDDYVPQDGE